jgi:hypothetical protein
LSPQDGCAKAPRLLNLLMKNKMGSVHAFGVGPQGCIGHESVPSVLLPGTHVQFREYLTTLIIPRFSLALLRLALCRLLVRYDISLASCSDKWWDIKLTYTKRRIPPLRADIAWQPMWKGPKEWIGNSARSQQSCTNEVLTWPELMENYLG